MVEGKRRKTLAFPLIRFLCPPVSATGLGRVEPPTHLRTRHRQSKSDTGVRRAAPCLQREPRSQILDGGHNT